MEESKGSILPSSKQILNELRRVFNSYSQLVPKGFTKRSRLFGLTFSALEYERQIREEETECGGCGPQRTHRVAIANLWRTGTWKNKTSLVRVGDAPLDTPFHYIYHHIQSCGVSSSEEQIHSPLFLLHPYKYVLCGVGCRWPCAWGPWPK